MNATATHKQTHARPFGDAMHAHTALAVQLLQRAPQQAVLAQANLSLSSVLALLRS
jgi:hypothetical protein